MSKKEPTDADATKPDQPPKQPKKRRWLRRLTWCGIILGIIGFLINGIVARKLAHHFLNKSLEDQGMTGTVEIQGSILSGFQVQNLIYTGTQGIQSLSIDEVTLDYQIMQLIDLKADKLAVTNLKAEIDIAKFKPSEKPDEASNWKETLKTIRPLIMHPEITLKDLDVTLLNDGQKLLHWKLGAIQHDATTDEINLNQWIISDPNNLSTPEQSATFVWQEGKLTSDRLKLLSELTLGEINFDWSSELKGDASLQYRDAIIDANIAQNTTLNLREGELRTDDLFKTLSTFSIQTDDIDTEAVINKLDLSIPTKDLQSAIPLWKFDGTLGIKSARWEKYFIENTTLSLKQDNSEYQLKLDSIALNTPLKIDLNGKWDFPDATNWSESTTAEVSFKTQLNDEILALLPQLQELPTEIKLNSSTIAGKVSAKLLEAQLANASANIDFAGVNVKGSDVPTLAIKADIIGDIIKFNLQPKEDSVFEVAGEFDSEKQTYLASFQAKSNLEDSPWINSFAEVYGSPIMLNNQLDLVWQGTGNLTSNTHQGTLTTTDLLLSQAGMAPAKINIKGTYDWPKSVDIETLSTEQEDLFANASILWDGKEVSIRSSEIKRDGELIGSIKGKLPFSTEIDSSKKFFAQTSPWDINIDTEPLLLKRLSELLPLSDDLNLTGTLQTKLNISGSPRLPQINGNIDVESLSDVFELGLDKISLNTKLATEDKLLNIDGNLLEAGKQLVTIDLQLPFTPHQWLEDDNLLETIQTNSELKGSAEIKQLPLGRLTKFVPDLEKLEGMLDVKAEFQGTIAEPKYKINFNADLPIISLKDAGIGDITNVKLKGELDQTMILDAELDAKINGGKFSIISKVDVNTPDAPIFDVKLTTRYALIYRDDVVAMRTNANLTLKGTLEDATISGDIGIVESLFYKDVDLIPIGVPTGSVGTVSLPSIDTKAKETLPIPAPFDQWKLDLTVNTEDPILIRGNVGSGRVEGLVKVRGILAKPSLDGTLYAKKVKAKLPFSVLLVNTGKIIFSPKNGFIPVLEIRGKSQVGSHSVTLFAYGSADDPKLALSSYPALPENEIMTLLATGTTNSGLEDRDVATFKTLQILLQELKQRSDRPGGNKLFSKVLSGIEDLDLKVGEVNDLTGEKYASATIKLHRRWFLTAQLDDNQPPQTRGLVIFALRFQ
ncbi:MAG: translocation/assembly module TamB domain-containing protein [Akkermansiaceae bacterium]